MANVLHALAFVLSVGNPTQEKNAGLLVESIRTFGGEYANAPIYIVAMDSIETPCTSLKSKGNIFIRTHKYSKNINFYFAEKVYASAQIEEEVENTASNLVWLDNEILVFHEPSKLVLKSPFKIGIRPVFLHNGISHDANTKADAYWNGIYNRTGVNPNNIPVVETVIDGKKIFASYNCQVVSVNPKVGIFREWAKKFDEILADSDYLKSAMPTQWHQFFLHQAVLSGVITSKIPEEEIFTLPSSYNYSLNKHLKYPKGKQIKRINDLTIAIHELTLANHPDWVQLYGVQSPLKEWLGERIPNLYKVNDQVYREEGSCNSYMIKTANGYVLVDPGGTADSTSWMAYYFKNVKPKAIILTHSHADHLRGISKWYDNYKVPIYINKNARQYIKDEEMLSEFYEKRALVQGNVPARPELDWEKLSYFSDIDTLQVDDLKFVLHPSPAETPDATVIEIPQLRAVICGDSYYTSFPNIGVLRGSVPRLTSGYINAMDITVNSKSEFLLPGHGEPIIGGKNVLIKAKNYRDAIQYVLDKTIEGMNSGKSDIDIMNEMTLPDSFSVDESYGRASWTAKGIYDYYNGWFNGSIDELYPPKDNEINQTLIKIAGISKIIEEANNQLKLGNFSVALSLTSIVLSAEPGNKEAANIRIECLNELFGKSRNYIERQWLRYEKKKLSTI
ncbi:MAG: MBL fold metallo-hydrolase [Bacteroidales bacterium]